MASVNWVRLQQGLRNGERTPPAEHRLADLTADLTRMLGDPDPQVRDGVAYPFLATWTEHGVYDDLLTGLGDGMCAGLEVGLGERDTDSVFRRSFSALVLAECIDRDTRVRRQPPSRILQWGDRLAAWWIRERDLRGFVPGKGWAHAAAHGADALGALARSPHFGVTELTVLLDVVADRVLDVDTPLLVHGEPDRIAHAVMEILRRNRVPLEIVEPWVRRLENGAKARAPIGEDVLPEVGNAQAVLRALYLQLTISPRQPAIRADLLLTLVGSLRRVHPVFLA
ncbi:hypothetical protein ASE01_22380 [Nocardioides sp. Root190]|uniref:DUF2785 domain-containing protein n=1 Tax=Nocardioides sp. Root190 TaxID=1736488 RepID=UPI000701DE77|nr:DUF2785 domain-containing protein [Nocardioides sp. Root190]KRB72791.1 hypothetical protein ASE01_22380 [Nocardioides sp. Root190]